MEMPDLDPGSGAAPAHGVRRARLDDAPGLATLNAVLGRSDPEAGIRTSLERILHREDETVLVGTGDADVVRGWIHAGEREVLGAGRRCEIIGLVVDPNARRQGLGRRLVAEAEAWAWERGLEAVLVRSNVLRADSHPFYRRLGYSRLKTQHVYRLTRSHARGARGATAPADTSVLVRHADPTRDVPSLVALNRVVQDLHAGAEPGYFRRGDDMPGIEEFHLAGISDEGHSTFVAEIGDQVVGYVTVERQRRGSHTFARATDRLHVDQVSVHPRHRRAGVGRALMRRVDDLAEELGIGSITLDTWSFNAEAQRFFEALGYEVYNLRFRKERPV